MKACKPSLSSDLSNYFNLKSKKAVSNTHKSVCLENVNDQHDDLVKGDRHIMRNKLRQTYNRSTEFKLRQTLPNKLSQIMSNKLRQTYNRSTEFKLRQTMINTLMTIWSTPFVATIIGRPFFYSDIVYFSNSNFLFECFLFRARSNEKQQFLI